MSALDGHEVYKSRQRSGNEVCKRLDERCGACDSKMAKQNLEELVCGYLAHTSHSIEILLSKIFMFSYKDSPSFESASIPPSTHHTLSTSLAE